jgi:hypothetical protein
VGVPQGEGNKVIRLAARNRGGKHVAHFRMVLDLGDEMLVIFDNGVWEELRKAASR